MVIFVVDDEENAIELLVDAIKEYQADAEVYTYDNAMDALDDVKDRAPDVVFSDIHMPMMTGLEFAMRLKTYNSKMNIIFVTGYSEYIGEAIKLHASGYITKPVTSSKIADELNNLLYPIDVTQSGVFCRTFGNFDLYVNGAVFKFKREKAKELFALLVDRAGEALTNEMIANYMFEEEPYDSKIKNQITTIAADLRKSLNEAGLDYLLIKRWGVLQLDKKKLGCDAYDYWDGQPYAINMFKGEYMENYSWAEESKAKFYWDSMKE